MLSLLNNSLKLIRIEVYYTLEMEHMHLYPLPPKPLSNGLRNKRYKFTRSNKSGDETTPDKWRQPEARGQVVTAKEAAGALRATREESHWEARQFMPQNPWRNQELEDKAENSISWKAAQKHTLGAPGHKTRGQTLLNPRRRWELGLQ